MTSQDTQRRFKKLTRLSQDLYRAFNEHGRGSWQYVEALYRYNEFAGRPSTGKRPNSPKSFGKQGTWDQNT